jgi:hypothetical protein
MSNFPLYDSLNTGKISIRDLTKKQKEALMESLSELGTETHQLIFILICVHYTVNGGVILDEELPYDMIMDGNDIDIDLLKLPHTLKRIIQKFIKVHNKSK